MSEPKNNIAKTCTLISTVLGVLVLMTAIVVWINQYIPSCQAIESAHQITAINTTLNEHSVCIGQVQMELKYIKEKSDQIYKTVSKL